MSNLSQRALGIPVDQNIGLGVEQYGTANGFRPVVIVGNPSQRGLDPANDNRNIFIGLLAALGINQYGTIRTLTPFITRRIGIIVTQLLIRRITIDHGVHISGGDPEEKIRLTEDHEGFFAVPIRLGNHADTETLSLQKSANHRHTKTGVIHIGVATNDDDVTTIPTQRLHLLARHRQEGSRFGMFDAMLGIGKE